jgi:glutaredoxin
VTVPAGLLLVTSEDCSFCTRAQDVLAELGIEVRIVDVASDEADELARRGIPLAFLPVLTDGESVIAYGRFSSLRLARELAA